MKNITINKIFHFAAGSGGKIQFGLWRRGGGSKIVIVGRGFASGWYDIVGGVCVKGAK